MPYGVRKDKGGDSTSNDARMEACVTAVMKKGKTQSQAIRICKVALFGKKSDAGS